MSWNFPHPPPPPPGAGPHPGPPPPPPGPPPYSGSPFWDFVNSFGPFNRSPGAGYGVDHADSPHGFTFGPAGFNAWSGRHGFQGNWGGRGGRRGGGRHGRCRHCPSDSDEETSGTSSGDEEMRDANAAATTMTPDTESPPQEGGVTDEKRDSPATMRDENENGGEIPDPPEEVPCSPPRGSRHGWRCGRGRHGIGHGASPFGGRGGRHGSRHGPHRGHSHPRHHHHHHHPRGPPPPPGGGPPPPFPFSFPFGGGPRGGGGPGGGAFDFNAMMNAFANHPFARGLREHWAEMQQHHQQRRDRAAAAPDNNGEEQQQAMDHNANGDGLDSGTFVPPVDIFNTDSNWTLHVAVPGAKKEDVNVHWDADRSTLTISGLVYRPGDEGFLNTLVSAERRVGLFERRVQLPPSEVSRDEDGEKEEVDADHITARMEDGILVVVVPKVEKEWTEVKKVDIE